jgi:hypothetical protein
MIEQLNVTQTITIDADNAWAAISGIGGLERWFPIITGCKVQGAGVGATRILTLADGAEMKDHIDEIDHQHRRLRYTRTESPLPVRSYRGTVDIRNAAEGAAEISWTVEIDVQEDQRAPLSAFLRQALSDGIQGLAQDLQHPAPTNRQA